MVLLCGRHNFPVCNFHVWWCDTIKITEFGFLLVGSLAKITCFLFFYFVPRRYGWTKTRSFDFFSVSVNVRFGFHYQRRNDAIRSAPGTRPIRDFTVINSINTIPTRFLHRCKSEVWPGERTSDVTSYLFPFRVKRFDQFKTDFIKNTPMVFRNNYYSCTGAVGGLHRGPPAGLGGGRQGERAGISDKLCARPRNVS